MGESYYDKLEREAAEKLVALLALPMPEKWNLGDSECFDPWRLFPALYGTYGGDFDECAIDVLRELVSGEKVRDDLGAEMFREMLCTAELCNYGTSPRVCFPNPVFKERLPELIQKWEAWSAMQWADDRP